jgi:uncharacterized protein (TIGR03643 family)
MTDDNINYCYYSDLPSPASYDFSELTEQSKEKQQLSEADIDRIIEMAWEDRTPFDAIQHQFGLSESEVRKLMKRELRFSSYKNWRKRVEACSTKHAQLRSADITRFKCDRQRAISNNRISKR